MAYESSSLSPPPSRFGAAYADAPRGPLTQRGISLRAAPDLTGFRRYMGARQRAEEIALAEAAIADGFKLRRGVFRRRRDEDVPDPHLRPITWAVARRRYRAALRTEEMVGPFDIEDVHLHHGLTAHAFVVNAEDGTPAVCGFRPRLRKIDRGRVAELAAASLDTNQKCRRCLVLLYRAALVGEPDGGLWPASDPVVAEAVEKSAASGAYITVPVRAPVTHPTAYGVPADAEPITYLDVRSESAADREAVAESAAEYADAGATYEALTADAGGDRGDGFVTPGKDALEEGSPQLTVIRGSGDALAAVLQRGIEDVLVVAASGSTAIIAGGIGRGADWAGSILEREHEPVLRRVLGTDRILHREGSEPQRICGPYWSTAAVIVPVDEDTCVVFGSAGPLELPEQLLVDAAHAATQRFEKPSTDVALADEREVAIALNRILDGAALSFEAALTQVLSTTASVLGCSVAAGVARIGRRLAMRAVDLDGADHLDPRMLLGGGPLLDGDLQVSIDDGVSGDEAMPGVVSRLRIPFRGSNVEGLLVMTHTSRRPRGFTTQDVRLAETIRPAAVLVLERAGFGEGLQALESHIRSAPSTDPLTGLANKAAWEQALASESDRLARTGGSAGVAAFRVEGLKRLDERHGPSTRDAAVRRAAELLRSQTRSTDMPARVGEDEFRVLIRDGGDTGARRLAVRVRRAVRQAQLSDPSAPQLAVSWATAQSKSQLQAASRLVGQRLRARARAGADMPRLGSGRPN